MENGRVLSPEYCGSNIMPSTKESCFMDPCPAWITGLWSPVIIIFLRMIF